MKIIIAGSMTISGEFARKSIMDACNKCGFFHKAKEIVHGCARGIDQESENVFGKTHLITRFPADWNKHGKRAGPIRNTEMAKYSDGLVAIWDGVSRGTEHMINIAHFHGLVVFVYEARKDYGRSNGVQV